MVEVVDTIVAALSAGANPIAAIREATGYTLEQLAVTSGLAMTELTEIEAGTTSDPAKLARLASALGLPEGTVG